jgi:hypothetical protein
MLTPVTAIQFHRPMGVGKTAPSLLTCQQDDGKQVELVVKFAAGCEAGIGALMREAIAALMAADLDLPVPEPFLVKVESDFIATIPEADERYRQAKANAAASMGWNFGSKKLPPGFSTIPKDRPVSQALMPMAAEILAFDTFIVNPDRTAENPNCQTNGREFGIFDHELAFRSEGVLFWKPPWENGGIGFPKGQPDRVRHVFVDEVRGSEPDFRRLAGAFDVLTDARLNEYQAALPNEWGGDGGDLGRILDYVRALKQNINVAITNLSNALR